MSGMLSCSKAPERWSALPEVVVRHPPVCAEAGQRLLPEVRVDPVDAQRRWPGVPAAVRAQPPARRSSQTAAGHD